MQQDGDKKQQRGENPHQPVRLLGIAREKWRKKRCGKTPRKQEKDKPPRKMKLDINTKNTK